MSLIAVALMLDVLRELMYTIVYQDINVSENKLAYIKKRIIVSAL